MPSKITRSSVERGRPPGFNCGNNSARTADPRSLGPKEGYDVEATERRGTLPGAGHRSPTLPLVFNISQTQESSHSLSHLAAVKSGRAGYGKRFALTLCTR